MATLLPLEGSWRESSLLCALLVQWIQAATGAENDVLQGIIDEISPKTNCARLIVLTCGGFVVIVHGSWLHRHLVRSFCFSFTVLRAVL